MIRQHYKNYKAKKLWMPFLGMVTVVVLLSLAIYLEWSLRFYLVQFKEDIHQLEIENVKFDKLSLQSTKSLELFNQSPEIRDKVINSMNPMLIESLIHSLGKKLNIEKLKLTMLKPEVSETNAPEFKYIDIDYLECNISFSAQTDVDAYEFVKSIEKYLSGYVQFIKFSIKPNTSVNNIDNILRKKIKPFDVTVDFLWQEIIRKEK